MSSRTSCRLKNLKLKIQDKEYPPLEAIQTLQSTSKANFVETAELHVTLGINPKYADQQLRATVILPSGTGKDVSIAVIARGDKELEARESGADLVGSEQLIEEIANGRLDFNYLITTPEMMPLIARLGKILGPRGVMPSPKAGTVTSNIREAIQEFKAGKVEYKADRSGVVHIPFGKMNFSDNDLLSNLLAIRESLERNRPKGAKGKYWKSIYIASTMGPSIPIQVNSLNETKATK
uniref:Ribosomal protein n=1 Tax=Gronococcus sybilensis TaxID=3028029 RepID=A0A9Y1I2D6_9RHOD|nr:ribosomal protein L1 [Gronococcus sybilensis]